MDSCRSCVGVFVSSMDVTAVEEDDEKLVVGLVEVSMADGDKIDDVIGAIPSL